MSDSFHLLRISGDCLQYVNNFKYGILAADLFTII